MCVYTIILLDYIYGVLFLFTFYNPLTLTPVYHHTEVLGDVEFTGSGSVSDKQAKHTTDEETGADLSNMGNEDDLTRGSMSSNRMTDWAVTNSERLSTMDPSARQSMSGRSNGHQSANMRNTAANQHVRESLSGMISTSRTVSAASQSELRPSFLGGSLKPNVPGNRRKL
jgi:hypothetical protein